MAIASELKWLLDGWETADDELRSALMNLEDRDSAQEDLDRERLHQVRQEHVKAMLERSLCIKLP
jgi:hypothetical protein